MQSAVLSVKIKTGYIEDLMYGRKRSFFIGAILRVLSILYGIVVRVRNTLYSVSLFRQKRMQQRVLSVGNITLGGTGKTPAVMKIAETLRRHHHKPAVVTRGYGRHDESKLIVVSDGKEVQVDAEAGGDEPVLIASKLEGVPVIADRDRRRAARYASSVFGTDTVILDDGFQHRRLQRDIDIVLIDAADPFGNGKLFPAGILREPLSALRRAQVVLITGIDRSGDPEILKRTIRRFTGARIFTSHPVPVDLIDVMTGKPEPLETLRDVAVVAFSGIARPSAFASMLESLGARVQAALVFPDHYAYDKRDLDAIRLRAADEKVDRIITTEKDAVRLKTLYPNNIQALRIDLKIVENDDWEAVLLHNV